MLLVRFVIVVILGRMVTVRLVTMMALVVDHLLPSDVELERLTAVP